MSQVVFTEKLLTERILKVFYRVYNDLGFGFLEVVYARAMTVALQEEGLRVETQVELPVSYRGHLLGIFRADAVVEGKVLLEYKVAEQISKAHEAQVTNYLRATTLEVGLVLNFGASPKARRIEFLNARKP